MQFEMQFVICIVKFYLDLWVSCHKKLGEAF